MTGTIWPQDSDDITESALGQAMALVHESDYVENGLGFNGDFQANTLDIGNGHAIIRSNQEARHVYPDGETGLALPVTSGVNYIYLEANFSDTTADAVSFLALSSDSPPTNPSLKIGEVDTSADTTTELNRQLKIDTSNLDAATLDGFEASDFAVTNEPTVTQSLTISGASATLALGVMGDGGPHAILPGNNAGEQQSALTYRTNPDEWTFEIADTAERIMTIPTDLTSMPTIYGQEIRTLQDSNSQPNFTVGPTAPQNPEADDVWIDTS